MESSSYRLLIEKLDAFIRKYYINLLLKGSIYATGVILSFFLTASFLEFIGRFGQLGRAILFYSFAGLTLFILTRFIIIPLLKLYRLGKIISYEEAARIIGKHFQGVNDKVLNTLQLKRQLESDPQHAELILASIDQRSQDLKPLPFVAAVDLSENKRYVKFLAIPFLVFISVFIISPSLLTESSKRIIQYNTTFVPAAPFVFQISNESLQVPSNEDFLLEVTMGGKELPQNIFIDFGSSRFKLNKEDKLSFNYLFKNVQSSEYFRLYADGFYSEEFKLNVLPSPSLMNFSIKLDYPDYTGRKDEIVSNIGDLNVPFGTKAEWMFRTQNTEELVMRFSDTAHVLNPIEKGIFQHKDRLLTNNRYSVIAGNKFLKSKDQVEYAISVVPDAYPSIVVEEKQDSTVSALLFFKGDIEDDYGFSKLQFVWSKSSESVEKSTEIVNVPFQKQFQKQTFFWSWDFTGNQLNPGDEIIYYFEVKDNDGVNGPKTARSITKSFRIPSADELNKAREERSDDLKADMKETLKDAKDLQKEIDELMKKLLEKKETGWQEKKKLQELLQRQEQIQQQVEEINKENKLNNKKDEEFREKDERILEKQKELERLFEQIMSEEMREKLKEMEKMMEEIDKGKFKEMLEEMKKDNSDLEKELDRSLELFKQLELDQKLNDVVDKLDKLKEEQDKLAEKSENKQEDSKDLKEEQDKLNEAFEELKKEIDDLEKKNEDLENPMELGDMEQMEKDIDEDMKESSESLKQGKQSKASKSQKGASDKMQKMSDKLKSMQQEMEEGNAEEDINKLRDLLENLLQLSFDQEKLMKRLYKTPPTDPSYVSIAAEQKKLKDDAKMIEDSLFALSKRVIEIEAIVNREMSAINLNLAKAITHLAERQSNSATSRQQYVMTSVNNLALLLSEVSNQLQQQMAQQQQGEGSCKKPGSKKKPGKGQKPSMGTMRQMQQQLNEQLKQMKEGMGKPGMQGKQMSEQLARMAAQQEMLRNSLQKMMNEMMKDGMGNTGEMRNMLNKMEQTETDIVNKQISQETLRRQQDILTRLLEAEKAERERDLDDKRESNENKNEQKRNISAFEQYKKTMQQEEELLRTISPELRPYYRNMVKDYFGTFN